MANEPVQSFLTSMITRRHAKIVGKRERACKKLFSKDHDLYKEKPKFQVKTGHGAFF